MPHSTKRKAGNKPPKFPLWLHSATGQWCKKVDGRRIYFGTDRDEALAEYVRFTSNGNSKSEPPKPRGALTLKDLCNHFLTHKKGQVESGELTQRSFDDYFKSCEHLVAFFGKRKEVELIHATELLNYRQSLATTRGPVTLGNEINRARVVLRFAHENDLTDRPIRFGEFKKPTKSVLRRHRSKIGERMFESQTLRDLLSKASNQLRAMMLLALNGGMGNADCARLPISVLDLQNRWADYPRPKTGIPRRVPLWAETVEALEAVLAKRRIPDDEQYADLVFVTKYRKPWFTPGKPTSAISAEFRKLLVAEGAYRKGLSFYTLRHVFQTVGEETGDQKAVERIMGHADSSMADHYRERFSDDRLIRVATHVHDWLFPAEEDEQAEEDDQ